MKDDAISRQWLMECVEEGWIKFDTQEDENRFVHLIRDIAPSAQPVAKDINVPVKDCISRQAALDIYDDYNIAVENGELESYRKYRKQMLALPSAQPPKEIPKRVLWTGWKGCRDTRYKCPNCEKPVRNDDTYCHRCGQRLMFPKISFTDYVPGEKQDVIVRWDDEG